MKVKAKDKFKFYRNKVLGLPKKDFRALQDGKSAEVDDALVEQYPFLFEKVQGIKEAKNGN